MFDFEFNLNEWMWWELFLFVKIFFGKWNFLNYGFFFTFLLKSNNLSELNKLFITQKIFKRNIIFFKYYNINLFKNYFFKNDFWGIDNRYFFISNDISLNFSDIYNTVFANISTYNYTKNSSNFYKNLIN